MTKKRTVVDGQHPRYWDDGNTDPYFYGVILHQPRGEAGVIEPDVIKLDDRGDGISRLGASIPWFEWWTHCFEINNPPAIARMLRYEADLFNNDQDPEVRDIDITKNVSAISQDFGGNLIAWDVKTATKLRLVSYRFDQDVSRLDPYFDNFSKKPWLYRLCTAVNASGSVFLPAGGVVQYMPRVARTELWIDAEKVKLLPCKPKQWTIENVMMSNDEPLRL